jgi:choline dehydrogenase-like flavoprotein
LSFTRIERRVVAAFAVALLPGGAGLPPAGRGGGVDVVEPLARLLAGVPPRVRLQVRLALRLFELTTFPRRFSRLPVERRAAYLSRLDSGPGGLRREIYLLLKTLSTLAWAREPTVLAAVGVTQRCRRADSDGDTRAPALERSAMRVPEAREECDVVVVGSGAGGAAAARALSEAGLSVIVLEEGSYHDAGDYSTDPLDALPMLYRDGGLTFCEGRPAIPLPLGRCVGGTTVINSGTCLRPPAEVVARWRSEHGIGWATDLDAEFDLLERDLGVKPVDPSRAGRNADVCRLGAEAIGASNGPIPRNAGNVVCCGTCPTGCALDAKRAMHVSELPRAVAAGARLRAEARVNEVVIKGGRATGVRCDGYEVGARAVVMAAGAIGTPQLLLAQGIANSSGAAGRRLHIHPACWVGGRFEDEVRGWDGVMQSWQVDEWRDRGLFLEATFTPFAFGAHWLPGAGASLVRRVGDYGRLAVIGVHLAERSSAGRVRVKGGRARVSYRLSEADAATIRFGIARAAEMLFAAGAVEVYPQLAGLPVLSRAQGTSAIEGGSFRVADLRLEAFHPMGTAAIGARASDAVVSPSGETHDVEGLYVADASIFPGSLGVNPMLTIMACARRIAAGLAERLS